MMRVEAEREKLLHLRKLKILSILSERESNKKSHTFIAKKKFSATAKQKRNLARQQLEFSGCKIKLPMKKA